MEEVTAGGGFPVDHFPGGKHAGQTAEFELGGQFLPGDPAGRGDGFVQRAGAGEGDFQIFGPVGESASAGERFVGGEEGECGRCRVWPPVVPR